MQNNIEPDFQDQLDAVFARLNPQAIEEFYTAYHNWSQQQRIKELRQRIETVRAQQTENEQRLREAQPSAIALAALARLQSNGVSDIALLDAMLERGESWLDQTMQRLDYFEQFDDFISDDYTRWCQGALEGAFDWIDALREGAEQGAPMQVESAPVEEPASSEDAAEVEALLLQRLATEHEDDLTWQEAITLKRPAIQFSPPDIVTGEAVEQEPTTPEDGAQPDAEAPVQVSEYIPQDEPAQSDKAAIDPDTGNPASAEEQILPETTSPVEDSALSASEPEQPALIEFAPLAETMPDEDEPPIGNNQPSLIESAPADEIPAVEDEYYAIDERPTVVEFDAIDEQPTLVEFATPAPAEASLPEEFPDYEIEAWQGESPVPEDVPVENEMSQHEENEPQAMEQSAPEEAAPYEEKVILPNPRNNPRKTGLIRGLIRLLTGN